MLRCTRGNPDNFLQPRSHVQSPLGPKRHALAGRVFARASGPLASPLAAIRNLRIKKRTAQHCWRAALRREKLPMGLRALPHYVVGFVLELCTTT